METPKLNLQRKPHLISKGKVCAKKHKFVVVEAFGEHKVGTVLKLTLTQAQGMRKNGNYITAELSAK